MNDEIPREIILREGESIQKIYGRSYLSFIMNAIIPSLIGGLIFIIFLEFSLIYSLLLSLEMIIPSWMDLLVMLNVLIFLIFIAIIILATLLGKPYCNGHKYLITNKRIILFKKFVIITRRDVYFDKLTDLLVVQGIIGRWKNYGDIQPITSGVEFGITQLIHSFRGITDPYKVKKELNQIIKK